MPKSSDISIREIDCFDLDLYHTYVGWKPSTTTHVRVYKLRGSSSFYVHDELSDKLHEFYVSNPDGLTNKQEFENVVKAFINAFT